MQQIIEAVYENGVLKPKQPLDLAEHEEVRLRLLGASSVADERCGHLKLNIDHRVARAIIESDDYELSELDDVWK